MKKFLLAIIVTSVLLISGCNNKESDALKFKHEYEVLNGEKNAAGLEYRTVDIDKNNPYIYITAEKIVEKIENGETFYVYFGDTKCPWCRSVIEKSIEVANKLNIDKIYYVNIWDESHNEILRDTYTLDDDKNLKKTHEGTKAYYKLLDYFDSILREYTLTDSEGNSVSVGEKRIYAPNYIYVENGEAKKLVSGMSSKQTNSREELTLEILEDEEEQFKNFFSN